MHHGGRPTFAEKAPSHSLKVKCPVENCTLQEGTLKSNLDNHFKNKVAFDAEGNPWKEETELEKERFSKLPKQKQIHTRYFRANGYNSRNLPRGKSVNPNQILQFLNHKKTQKRKIDKASYFLQPANTKRINSEPFNDEDSIDNDLENSSQTHSDDEIHNVSGRGEKSSSLDNDHLEINCPEQDNETNDDEIDQFLNDVRGQASQENTGHEDLLADVNSLTDLPLITETVEKSSSLEIPEQDVEHNNNTLLTDSAHVEKSSSQSIHDQEGNYWQERETAAGDEFQPEIRNRNDNLRPAETVDAEKLAQEIYLKLRPMISNLISSKEDKSEDYATQWIEMDDTFVCSKCVNVPLVDSIPSALLTCRKKNFGIVSKKQEDYRIYQHQKMHEETPLHRFMFSFVSKQDKDKKRWEEDNQKAASLVILNGISVLLNGGSSQDFVKLNSKDMLAASIMGNWIGANKNNSKAEFFSIRDCLFTRLSMKAKDLFKKVGWLSVTLDKVTQGQVSYTVFVCYYFYQGRIRTYLNSVYPMKSSDYSSLETAQMTIRVLMASTGLSVEGIFFKKRVLFLPTFCRFEKAFASLCV